MEKLTKLPRVIYNKGVNIFSGTDKSAVSEGGNFPPVA